MGGGGGTRLVVRTDNSMVQLTSDLAVHGAPQLLTVSAAPISCLSPGGVSILAAPLACLLAAPHPAGRVLLDTAVGLRHQPLLTLRLTLMLTTNPGRDLPPGAAGCRRWGGSRSGGRQRWPGGRAAMPVPQKCSGP